MNKKNKTIRERIKPKIWDVTFLLAYNNITTFRQILILLINDLDKIKVLDLGCGYKPFKLLLPKFEEYVGIDFSHEDAEPDIILDLNKDNIPFPDKYFDLVIISEVLEHLYNYENCLKEAVRVLKNGGLMYVSSPFMFPEHGVPYDFHRYTEFFYKRKLEEMGLKILLLKKSGTFFSVPLVLFNFSLYSISAKLKIEKFLYPVFTLQNIILYCFDTIVLKLANVFKLKYRFQHFYVGLSLIAKKQCD